MLAESAEESTHLPSERQEVRGRAHRGGHRPRLREAAASRLQERVRAGAQALLPQGLSGSTTTGNKFSSCFALDRCSGLSRDCELRVLCFCSPGIAGRRPRRRGPAGGATALATSPSHPTNPKVTRSSSSRCRVAGRREILPLCLGVVLTDYIFLDHSDGERHGRAEEEPAGVGRRAARVLRQAETVMAGCR